MQVRLERTKDGPCTSEGLCGCPEGELYRSRRANSRVAPAVGLPGFVTIVAGRIPRHAEVTLAWDPGIGEVEVTADVNGQFRIPMLILPGDVRRRGRSSTAHRFADVEAPFLVEPATVQSRDFVSRS